MAIKKKFREFIDNLGYQQKIESAKLHLKQDDESVSDFLRRSADPLKEAATVAAEKTVAVASKIRVFIEFWAPRNTRNQLLRSMPD